MDESNYFVLIKFLKNWAFPCGSRFRHSLPPKRRRAQTMAQSLMQKRNNYSHIWTYWNPKVWCGGCPRKERIEEDILRINYVPFNRTTMSSLIGFRGAFFFCFFYFGQRQRKRMVQEFKLSFTKLTIYTKGVYKRLVIKIILAVGRAPCGSGYPLQVLARISLYPSQSIASLWAFRFYPSRNWITFFCSMIWSNNPLAERYSILYTSLNPSIPP